MRNTTLVLAAALLIAASAQGAAMDSKNTHLETATLAGGCFWCLEAFFQELTGVTEVVSGFAGGGKGEVSYQEVCTGETGHAEVVRLHYDPTVISFAELLTVFFAVHDPTTLNRQGADAGIQYRSAIFWHDEAQRDDAVQVIAELAQAGVFPQPIVTDVTPFDAFIRAEDHHQDYYLNNRAAPYCRAVIDPKLEKFRKKFRDRLQR